MTTTTAVKPSTTTVNFTNNAEGRALLAEIARLKEIERAGAQAEKDRKVAEAKVRELMGTAESIIVRGSTVAKLSSERATNLYDYKLLAEGWPEAYAAVHSTRPYRFLQVL